MDSKPPSPRYAWFLLAFLTLLNVFNFVDRQLIQSLAVLIKKDLGLSNTQIALLAGIVFSLFYTSVGIYLGTRADKGNRPLLIAFGLFLWSPDGRHGAGHELLADGGRAGLRRGRRGDADADLDRHAQRRLPPRGGAPWPPGSITWASPWGSG